MIEVGFDELGELKESPEEIPPLHEFKEEWRGAVLGKDILRHALRFSAVSSCWWSIGEDSPVGGEFRVIHLYDVLLRDPPPVALSGASESEYKLFRDLRMIDHTPYAGAGMMVYLRIRPGSGEFELWYMDVDLIGSVQYPRGYARMDLSYCDYLDALLITKGTFGWQYLYTDVSLRDEIFRAKVDRLRGMLDIFPKIFPEYDYSPLVERLAERL